MRRLCGGNCFGYGPGGRWGLFGSCSAFPNENRVFPLERPEEIPNNDVLKPSMILMQYGRQLRAAQAVGMGVVEEWGLNFYGLEYPVRQLSPTYWQW
ncbi:MULTISPECIES: hypothetical protein [Niastella]|uniref:Uncharacterized protein n=1 Tax=Niastella soli TaxID=2821487 RepID=A0ABS3Z0P2_9BACT|nr:hypothetical protein [Niastella soli]MBO9203723.1 hypothetical protein [Niastella soli]